jgi:hypothetical protein
MARNKKQLKKKAELTSNEITTLVILVISFIIILLLWKIYYWNPIINQESCHQSVVFRSSVNFGLIKSSKIVPLKCQTEKTCMTMGGKDCLQVGKPSKDNVITKINLDKDPEKSKQQVIDEIADEMYSCHSMLGEGKLQFMPEGFFANINTKNLKNANDMGNKNYCLICSRIVLDDEAMEKVPDIAYSELYMALSRKVTPDKKTYLEYIHPDWKDWHGIYQLFQAFKESNAENYRGTIANMDLKDWKINMSNEGGIAIIAQETTKDYWPIIAGTAAVVGGTALVASGVGAPVGISMIGAGAAGAATFWYNSPTGDFYYSPPSVHLYNLKELQAMQCDSFETAP